MELNIDYKLTDKDFDKIAEKVIQKQSDEVFMKKVIETSEKVAEKHYWNIFGKFHQDLEIDHLFKKHLAPLVSEQLKTRNLIEIELSKVLNTDKIKQLGIQRLRDIAFQLQKEIDDSCENN